MPSVTPEMVEKARQEWLEYCPTEPAETVDLPLGERMLRFAAFHAASAVQDAVSELRPYTDHDKGCPAHNYGDCDCGLDALREKYGVSCE